jgi:hypothetical protein
MPEGFQVVVEALQAHARSLGEVSDLLKEANQSAGQTMPSNAYGALGEALPAMLEQLASKGRDAILASVTSADQMTSSISTTAEEYQAVDEGTAENMDGMYE